MAAAAVEDQFPPATAADVYRVVVSLNLLNAAVKQSWGRLVTGYEYIKGMAACLFLWLLYHPKPGVATYWSADEQVTYFSVYGQQLSFHYVPLLNYYRDVIQRCHQQPIIWDGVQRQLIAVRLFKAAFAVMPQMDAGRRVRLRRLMVGFCKAQLLDRVRQMEGVAMCIPDSVMNGIQKAAQCTASSAQRLEIESEKWRNLQLALKFNPWRADSFELTRPVDSWHVRVARYRGDNIRQVAAFVAGRSHKMCSNPKIRLLRGRHYYLQRANWRWRHMTTSRCLMLMAHHNFLTVGKRRYNLCVTYAIACYLAAQYPELRFLNVLNYTRLKVHRRLYTYRALLRVPPNSKSRTLKVWMVVDREYLLRDFDLDTLPRQLWKQYQRAKDYVDFFVRVRRGSHVGLVAYSRFHLLKPVYTHIRIYGHYARVKNDAGKWAVYSLLKEKFETGFDFDRIWYDQRRYAIMAIAGNAKVVIHEIIGEEESSVNEPSEPSETGFKTNAIKNGEKTWWVAK